MLSSVASAHHISPADWTGVNSGSAGPTDEMSLLTLEHLRLSCEPLITNRTLGYSALDTVPISSPHHVQDLSQVSLPRNILVFAIQIFSLSLPCDGLQVFAVSVHSVKIHPRSVDKAASHLYLVVLEAVHHWSVSIAVLDVPVVVHSPVSTE